MYRALCPPRMRRRLWSLLAFSCCFLAGCIDRSSDGNTSVYSYSWWIIGLAVLGGVNVIYVGFKRPFNMPLLRGYFYIVVGMGFLAVGIPMLHAERVEVDSKHFTSCTGLVPGHRLHHDVPFEYLQEIRIEISELKFRFETEKVYTLRCQFKTGKVEKVSIGMLMRPAVGEILRIARQKRVPVVGEDLLPKEMRLK